MSSALLRCITWSTWCCWIIQGFPITSRTNDHDVFPRLFTPCCQQQPLPKSTALLSYWSHVDGSTVVPVAWSTTNTVSAMSPEDQTMIFSLHTNWHSPFLLLAQTEAWVQPTITVLDPFLNLMSFAMVCTDGRNEKLLHASRKFTLHSRLF
jgi:hypothetical protein